MGACVGTHVFVGALVCVFVRTLVCVYLRAGACVCVRVYMRGQARFARSNRVEAEHTDASSLLLPTQTHTHTQYVGSAASEGCLNGMEKPHQLLCPHTDPKVSLCHAAQYHTYITLLEYVSVSVDVGGPLPITPLLIWDPVVEPGLESRKQELKRPRFQCCYGDILPKRNSAIEYIYFINSNYKVASLHSVLFTDTFLQLTAAG